MNHGIAKQLRFRRDHRCIGNDRFPIPNSTPKARPKKRIPQSGSPWRASATSRGAAAAPSRARNRNRKRSPPRLPSHLNSGPAAPNSSREPSSAHRHKAGKFRGRDRLDKQDMDLRVFPFPRNREPTRAPQSGNERANATDSGRADAPCNPRNFHLPSSRGNRSDGNAHILERWKATLRS